MADILGNNVVDKNILAVMNKNPNVEITQVKIKPEQKKRARTKAVTTEKTITTIKRVAPKRKKVKKIKVPTKTIVKQTIIKNIQQKKKKDPSVKHVKDLKKQVKSLSSQVRKKEALLHKKLLQHTGEVQEVKQQIVATRESIDEAKRHYAHIPKLSMETQMLIESMNKLSAVVKQLLVLFNHKIANEEGPLFVKLDELAEQNEKIAQGILVIAELVKEQQTPKAQIKEVNPYMQRMGPQPLPVRPMMPEMRESPQIPADLGKFQFPDQEPQPIPQFSAPLPPFSPVPKEELPLNRKRLMI